MTEQAERYDRIADGYARWWGPIIAPAALTVLDEIQEEIDGGATRLLDVGTGTGTLAIAAIRRWPDILVTAIDASSGMIEKAAADADASLTPEERRRLTLRVAFADDLGLADGSIDVAVSSFVLQLVPSRFRALREVRRVLRRGGYVRLDQLARGLIRLAAGRRLRRRPPRRGRGGPRLERRLQRRPARRAVRDRPDAARRLRGRDRTGRGADPRLRRRRRGRLPHRVRRGRPRREPRRPATAFEAALRRRLAARPARELALHNRTVTVRGVRR